MASRYNRYGVFCALIASFVMALGCSTRSISNAGYPGGWRGHSSMYEGELHEYNVLGIEPGVEISDTLIAERLDSHEPLSVPPGSRVLLIQSGALMPDEPMRQGLAERYTVNSFSGIPQREDKRANYASALRLAAANGGCRFIICYWGVLETAQSNLPTKAVSWVPIVGSAIPDKAQQMRIRLKVVCVDVETGRWAMVTPATAADKGISAKVNRAEADQAQVANLKADGYAEAVEAIFAAWGR